MRHPRFKARDGNGCKTGTKVFSAMKFCTMRVFRSDPFDAAYLFVFLFAGRVRNSSDLDQLSTFVKV